MKYTSCSNCCQALSDTFTEQATGLCENCANSSIGPIIKSTSKIQIMKKLFITAALLIVSIAPSFAADKVKCHGKTLAGKECSRNAQEGKEYCFQHNPAGNHCGATTKSGTPCKVAVKAAGDKCFHHKAKA